MTSIINVKIIAVYYQKNWQQFFYETNIKVHFAICYRKFKNG